MTGIVLAIHSCLASPMVSGSGRPNSDSLPVCRIEHSTRTRPCLKCRPIQVGSPKRLNNIIFKPYEGWRNISPHARQSRIRSHDLALRFSRLVNRLVVVPGEWIRGRKQIRLLKQGQVTKSSARVGDAIKSEIPWHVMRLVPGSIPGVEAIGMAPERKTSIQLNGFYSFGVGTIVSAPEIHQTG